MHVAVAVIVDRRRRVLLSRRPAHVHQGGLWEFPGGKCEAGEDARQALLREVHEELGLRVQAARPLIRVPYRYPDKSVLLDVWRVEAFSGRARGREGQPLEWVPLARLHERSLPAANRAIVTALRLPDRYLITPEPVAETPFLHGLDASLQAGVRLVQLRAGGLLRPALAAEAVALCRRFGARVLINADAGLARETGADGVHLKSSQLNTARRPLPEPALVGASCHNARELAAAQALGADFAVLSPLRATPSHPQANPIGWACFAALTGQAALPVYALGGLGPDDIDTAQRHGGQGIAAIRGLWQGEMRHVDG